ncbi:beta-aspartyl-peptidase [Vibrio hannami]|uniref:beta-aspartyl-peptidase n=1 Tax=Vibrio hannami TaxID=2717094 RepID=UPI00240EA253|nr:beta-aspartyl-peptidase [Vibrio hannami]MDG3084828.1 beta-aspartyl-peptidase [Vibrio hannami]
MFTLLKNARIFAPEELGVQDILIAGGKIAAIGLLSDSVSLPNLKTEDLEGRTVTPGIIDQHVHLIGGGGEAGFASRTPEIEVSTIVKYGVTSVLGLIGTDCDARHPSTLFAKAKALNEEGISAWMLTGGYNVPSPTITGSVRNDILYADLCIGGKLAISDHRSPHISYDEFIRYASDCRVAGMLSGKAGTLTVHLGDAPQHLELLFRASKESAIPRQQFIPTHINRHKSLYDEVIKWGSLGGRMDITTGFEVGDHIVSTLDAVVTARENGIAEECISVSTDAQGSMPIFNDSGELMGMGVGEQDGLLKVIKDQVRLGYSLSEALMPVTSTVADWLKLDSKGKIETGKDADFVIFGDDLEIEQTWAKGQCVFRDSESLIRGLFTKQ